MFWLDWRSWAQKERSVKGKENYSLPAAAKLGCVSERSSSFHTEILFFSGRCSTWFKKKKREGGNCDGVKERRVFSLERAIFSLKRLEPSPFSSYKHWNSGCVSQVCPKVGSSRIWAATTVTKTWHCCRPGGMNREPCGKQGEEPEEGFTDLVSEQMDGSKWPVKALPEPWATTLRAKTPPALLK